MVKTKIPFLFFICMSKIGGEKLKESEFQRKLIVEIETRFPGSIVLKNDPTYIQGFPDLMILYQDHWAALECKRSKSASRQPNQAYYVNMLKDMSYSAFVYPENKEVVLNEMARSFEAKARR